jgi:hypothetical protein
MNVNRFKTLVKINNKFKKLRTINQNHFHFRPARPGSYHFLFNFNPLSGQNVRDLFAVRNSLTCNVPKYLLKSLLRLQQTGIG